ncbi:hypothetical protein [Mesorhizobium sp.]|uniref:hypothetical protein n=1 Tax=Mesorhizobium sp. TaxID=1871066 RepID=UPI00257DD74B|nr:hypothetical protein [Mesorhizobium sp.]
MGLWLHHQKRPAGSEYNLPVELRVKAPFDIAADLAPSFYPVLSSFSAWVTCSPSLDRSGQELPGVMAQGGTAADEPFISDIGGVMDNCSPVRQALRQGRLPSMGGQIVDATIVAAPKQPNTDARED